MKKFSAIILCLALLCGVGCARNEPKQQTASFSISTEGKLSPSQYKAALEERWEAFRDPLFEWVALMPENESDCDEPEEFQALRGECEPLFDQIEEALLSFSELNPPEEYKELHQKLLDGADRELDWLKYTRKQFSAKTQSELDKASQKAAEIMNDSVENEKSFPSAFFDVIMALSEDGVE